VASSEAISLGDISIRDSRGHYHPGTTDAEYLPVRHLAQSVFLGHDWRKCIFAMYTGYFDASGDLTDVGFVVSGYVATVEDWERFDGNWRIALAHDNVPYFHMKEFAHFKGPFEGWQGQDSRRANFLGRLADIISETARRGFSTAVTNQVFNEVNEEYCLEEHFGNPYAFCGLNCAVHTRRWLRNKKYEVPVKYIFEYGDQGWHHLEKSFERSHFPPPIRERKRSKTNPIGPTPLEAADFAAWENLKATRTAEFGNLLSMGHLRKSFASLMNITDNEWGIYTHKHLVDLCKKLRIPLRKNLGDWGHSS
jgi:hypothetical protein